MRHPYVLYKRIVNGKRIWYYYFYSQSGKRICRSTGMSTKSKADAYCMKMWSDGKMEEAETSDSSCTFREYTNGIFNDNGKFNEFRKSKGLSPLTKQVQKQHGYCLNKLVEIIGDYKMANITYPVLRKAIERIEEGYEHTAKRNAYVYTLRGIFKIAFYDEIIKSNPAEKLITKTNRRRDAFTQEEVLALLGYNHRKEDARLICLISATTGMRLGEIIALTKDDIHDGYITVTKTRGNLDTHCPKNKKSRIVPCSSYILEELRKLPQFNDGCLFCYTLDSISKYFSNLCRQLGMEGKTFHSFRHYFNTMIHSENTISDAKKRAMIAHSDDNMTDHYYHLEVSDNSDIISFEERLLKDLAIV